MLLAAVSHAGWNALVKAAGDRLLTLAAIRFVGLALGCAALPFVPLPRPESWPLLAAATAAHFVYYILLLHSYRIGDLSLVHPVSRGLAPVLLALLAWLALGERLNGGQAAAVALIVAGIGALAVGRSAPGNAVRFAMATGVAIAAYSFFGAVGVRAAGTVLGFQAVLEILTGLGVVGWTLAVRRAGAVLAYARTSGRVGLLAGLLSVAGYGAYLLAASVLPMAAVAALRESSTLFSALIGTLVLKEGFGARRIAAAVLITAGIVALGLR